LNLLAWLVPSLRTDLVLAVAFEANPSITDFFVAVALLLVEPFAAANDSDKVAKTSLASLTVLARSKV